MIRYRLFTAILGICIAFVQVPSTFALSNAEIKKEAKSITIMFLNSYTHGSGVIVKRDGQIYTAVTSRHVIEPNDNFTVMAPDGNKYEIELKNIKFLPNVDIAIFQFKSFKSYRIAKIGNLAKNLVGSDSFVAGFPEVSVPLPPPLYFSSGKVVLNSNHSLGGGYALGYNNLVLPGMSGGPVLDKNGELIGIDSYGAEVKVPEHTQPLEDLRLHTNGLSYAVPVNKILGLVPQINQSKNLLLEEVSTQSDKIIDYFLNGIKHQKERKFKDAIIDFTEDIRIHPEHALSYFNRGNARLELNDYKGQIEDSTEVIRLNSQNYEAYYNRGVAHLSLGDKQNAIEDFNQAIRLNLSLSEAYNNLGNIYSELNKAEEAKRNYELAIKFYPDDAFAHNNLGNLLSKLGNRRDAIKEFTLAIQSDLSNPKIYYDRGNTRFELEDYQGAIQDYNQVIQLDPNFALAYSNRCVSWAKLGSAEKAIADCNQAATLFKAQNEQSLYEKVQSNLLKIK